VRAAASIPFELVAAPRVLHAGDAHPKALLRTDVRRLCELAEIPMQVTGGPVVRVVVYVGREHLRSSKVLYVGVEDWKPDRVHALRALEVLAHGFHNYAARECVCGRGLFSVPKLLGRPPVGGRAMTATERMRKMRATSSPARPRPRPPSLRARPG
jgi:hypothetical protein